MMTTSLTLALTTMRVLRRQRRRLLQSRIYVFGARSLSSVEVGQRLLSPQSPPSSQSSVPDVCLGVCLVKRNLAALLKFPARYLVALRLGSAKLEPPAGYT